MAHRPSPRQVRDPGDLHVSGRRLTLRYPRASDAQALYELASDPAVTRFFSWGPHGSVEESASHIAGLPARRAAGALLEFAIVDRQAGVIGITALSELAARDRRAVLGTWLGRRWWGQGANREAKALLLHLAFEGLGLRRVTAWCGTENVRSQRALERLGFVREGVLAEWHVHRGRPRDVIAYRLLRAEWERSGLSGEPAALRGKIPAPFIPNQSPTAERPAPADR